MKIYSRHEVLALLGCSFKTVYRLSVRALGRTSGPYTADDIERMRSYQKEHGVQSEATKRVRREAQAVTYKLRR